MPSGWVCIHGWRRRDCRSRVCWRMDLARNLGYRRQWLCHRLREQLAFSTYRFVWLDVDDWPACQHVVWELSGEGVRSLGGFWKETLASGEERAAQT